MAAANNADGLVPSKLFDAPYQGIALETHIIFDLLDQAARRSQFSGSDESGRKRQVLVNEGPGAERVPAGRVSQPLPLVGTIDGPEQRPDGSAEPPRYESHGCQFDGEAAGPFVPQLRGSIPAPAD